MKDSTEVQFTMFSGNLFQSVIVLGKKDSFLYCVLQDGIWKLFELECHVCGIIIYYFSIFCDSEKCNKWDSSPYPKGAYSLQARVDGDGVNLFTFLGL